MTDNPWASSQPGWQAQGQPFPQASPGMAAGTQGGSSSNARKALIVGAVVLVIALVAGGVWGALKLTRGGNVATMAYISADDSGPEPFMGSVASEETVTRFREAGDTGDNIIGPVDAATDNLYGFVAGDNSCDMATLQAGLDADPELSTAFAAGIGIEPADLTGFVESLSAVVLMQDTWVTNHSLIDGQAVPFQSVLQAGTGVLVDAYGIPRVRCACGNPLAQAWPGYTAPSDESPWDGYARDRVAATYSDTTGPDQLVMWNIGEGRSESIEISAEARSALENAAARIDDDTVVTTPADMGVVPDEDLLESLGLPAASGDGSKRTENASAWNGHGNLRGAAAKSPVTTKAPAEEAPAEEAPKEAPAPAKSTVDIAAMKQRMGNLYVPELMYQPAGPLVNGVKYNPEKIRGQVWIGNGWGFGDPEPFDPQTIRAVAGDINGDGEEEIIVEINNFAGGSAMWVSLGIYDQDLQPLGVLELHNDVDPGGMGMFQNFTYFDVRDGNIYVEYWSLEQDLPKAAGPRRYGNATVAWLGGNEYSVLDSHAQQDLTYSSDDRIRPVP